MAHDEDLQGFVERFGLDVEAHEALLDLVDALRGAGGDPYDDLGPIASGGVGEVRRVLDRELRRPMALKRLRASVDASPQVVARFVEEARVTAQLQHPGVVPVHRMGELADGRPFYTMKEIEGRTLFDVLQELHEAQDASHWVPSPSGWTLRRLLEAVHRVCETIAYAHHRGVLHRDLKPDNIMLGDFGEVWVVDWGLARVMGAAEAPEEDVAADIWPLDTLGSGRRRTQVGTISGTPAYMAPEQAWGEPDAMGPATDVYGLGAVLHEVLTGRPPYTGVSGFVVLEAVRTMPVRPVSEGWQGPEHPAEVAALCMRALARDPEARWPSARAMAEALGDWLDGAKRREEALALVAQAEAMGPEIEGLRAEAAARQQEAVERLADVPAWAPAADKVAAWGLQDQARALTRQANQAEVRRRQLLAASLTQVPELPEAHAALVDDHLAQHAAAEAVRDAEAMAEVEVLLRAHVEALPLAHATRVKGAAYLEGDATLTLHTEPAGAEVVLYRVVERDRRLVPERVRGLGATPLVDVPLAMGSFLLRVQHPDCAPVDVPVCIARQRPWRQERPGDEAARPLRLPAAGSLGPDERFVPEGWFQHGHPTSTYALRPGWLWCDGFVMRRFQVTNREYLAFLDDLVQQGREADALRWAPRERAGAGAEQGALIYGRRPDGGFELRADADGDTWGLDWPVVMVDWPSAMAFAAWEAERTALPWRLPAELEWEKAARGVDGRLVPWGEHVDPSWCCVQESHRGRALPQPVSAYPDDVSIYGVRGMAGNVADWCLEPFVPEGPDVRDGIVRESSVGVSAGRDQRVVRGGNWMGSAVGARSSYRAFSDAHSGVPQVGFRLVRAV